jgi:hypothetical protein
MGADHHVAAVLDNLEEGEKFFLGKSGGEHRGKGERRKEKSASKREQRQVYLNVAEREQIQVRKAGLKEKDHPEWKVLQNCSFLRTLKEENGKIFAIKKKMYLCNL